MVGDGTSLGGGASGVVVAHQLGWHTWGWHICGEGVDFGPYEIDDCWGELT